MTSPTVDEYDVLRNDARWVALGPVEAKIARLLTEHPGEVVSRAELEAVAWAGTPVRPNTIDRQMHRLRNHLLVVGLALHTIRGHGYVLEVVANLT
jgi:DNA-binding winged helix-turn-helix (wHTH) protein